MKQSPIILLVVLWLLIINLTFDNNNSNRILSEEGCCSILIESTNTETEITYYDNINNDKDITICSKERVDDVINSYQEWCYLNHSHKN